MRASRFSVDRLLLEDWEAVPLTAPLLGARGAGDIKRCWSPVRVPGHWQLEEAFVAYEGRLLYRCRFEVRAPRINEMATLRFGGICYAARVWLNGVYLGDHERYLAPFEFDCTEAVVEGENELLVEVYSPEEPDENDRKTVRETNHLYFGWYYGRFRDLERAIELFPGLIRLPTEYGLRPFRTRSC